MTFRKTNILQRSLKLFKYLTKAKEEEYERFIERIEGNALAARIKIADLEDNLNFERIKEPNEDDLRHYERYRRALATLRKAQQVSPSD